MLSAFSPDWLGFGDVNLEFLKYFELLFVSECDLRSENLFLLEESLSNLGYNFECCCE